jgi:two-component system response regulator ChvI
MTMIKIILVDNKRSRLEPLRQILLQEDYDVQTVADGQVALSAVARSTPHLILINLPTSKIDGMTLLERIRANSIVPIIMLGELQDEIDEIMGLRLGADAYVHMPVSPRLLCERIKGLLRRHAVLLAHAKTDPKAERSFVCGNVVIDPSRYKVVLKSQQVPMTVTEFNILMELARRPGVVKTREQLAMASHSEDSYSDCRAIDYHIKRIRKKMHQIDPSFNYIETLYGLGYRFSEPGSHPRAALHPDASLTDQDQSMTPAYSSPILSPRLAALPDRPCDISGPQFKPAEKRSGFSMDGTLAEMVKQ